MFCYQKVSAHQVRDMM